MMEIDKVINGYLRLYCAILGLPMSAKRCWICGSDMDSKYPKRGKGYLCKVCYLTEKVKIKPL